MRLCRWNGHQSRHLWRKRLILSSLLIGTLAWGDDWNIVLAQSTGFVPAKGISLSLTGTGRPFRGGFRQLIPGRGLSVGPVTLHPHFGFGEIYTDNTFRTDLQKEEDYIHVVATGVQAALPFASKHVFLLDYGFTKQINQRFSSNDVETMDAYGRLTLNLPSKINVDLQGGHSRGYDERGTAVDIQSLEPNKWRTNSFLGQMEVFGAWAGARLTGKWTEWRFFNNDQSITRDRTTTSTGLTLFGKVAPTTNALISFTVTDRSYDRNKQLDSFSYRVSSGLTWEVTGKSQGEIRGGYEVLNFDRAAVPSPGPGLSAGGDKQETVFFGGYFEWQATPRLLVSLRPSRSIQQTAVVNTSSFTQTLINVNVDYGLTTRTHLSGFLGFINDRFSNPITLDGETKRRDDNTITAGFGLDYKTIKWLGFRADYRYQERDSSFSRFDFSANSVIVSAEVLF